MFSGRKRNVQLMHPRHIHFEKMFHKVASLDPTFVPNAGLSVLDLCVSPSTYVSVFVCLSMFVSASLYVCVYVFVCVYISGGMGVCVCVVCRNVPELPCWIASMMTCRDVPSACWD